MSEKSAKLLHIHTLEAGYQFLSVLRQPAFALPTLLFPAMFYIFFGLLLDGGRGGMHMPTYLLSTFGTFGIMAPALFGFGVAVASERAEGWLRLKLASPMPPGAFLTAKLTSSMLFGLVVVMILYALGAVFGGVRLATGEWALLAGILVMGTLPFAAIGLFVGLVAGGQAAPAIVNLIYLPMAFLSGLWVPIRFLPEFLQDFATLLPAYHLAQLGLGAVGQPSSDSPAVHVAVLAGFTVLFLVLARRAWHRAQH